MQGVFIANPLITWLHTNSLFWTQMNPVEFPGGNPIQQGERRLFPNSPEAIPIPSGRGGFRHSELGSSIFKFMNNDVICVYPPEADKSASYLTWPVTCANLYFIMLVACRLLPWTADHWQVASCCPCEPNKTQETQKFRTFCVIITADVRKNR